LTNTPPESPEPIEPVRKVERSDILDYETYGDRRDTLRAMVMEIKRRRRVHLGASLTFLFENTTTIWYQIQEMVRAERIVREADIQHEIDTYNAVLGEPGELGCCLLIEIEGEVERPRLLREWRMLPGHIYMRCGGGANGAMNGEATGGTIVRAEFDPAQANDEQLSSVQYLRFKLGDLRPMAVGCDLQAMVGPAPLEVALNEEQREALNRDLGRNVDSKLEPVASGHHGGPIHQRLAPKSGAR
jgi:hypothetical protein